MLGVYNRWRGDTHKTLEIMDPIMPLLKEAAPLNFYLEATFIRGLALGERGRYQEAIGTLVEGRELGLRAGERYGTPKNTNSLGWAYHELCHFDKAIEYNNQALDSIQELLGPGTSNLFEIESQTRINLGENYLMTGDLQKARQNLELVYDNAKKAEYYFIRPRWKPRCLLGLGELWLQAGDTDKAESFLSELIEHQWTDKFPYKKRQVRAWLLRSGILSARGQLDEAETELKRALAQAKHLGNPTLLWKTYQAMGTLLLTRGKNKDARAEFKAALKVVQGIAEGLTDTALKEGFLESKPIQELFSQAEVS
jgi:tetratricopeptide (TPR) repeat protein